MKFKMTLTGLNETLTKINNYSKEAQQVVEDELQAGAVAIASAAKRAAPVDEGGALRNSIGTSADGRFQHEAFASVFYAPYIEFGTGPKVKIPSGYEQFAAQFKGPANRGNMKDFFKKMVAWVKRNKVAGTYSVKSRRRTGSKDTQDKENEQAAYAIMISILRNGITPRPFLIPAYQEQQGKILNNIAKNIRGLK